MREHYLDNAATTKPCEAAAKAAVECLTECYGNPSSLHKAGLSAQRKLEHSRAVIAKTLGCDTREIIFTSCATESTNTALRSTAAAYGKKRKKIITSAVEHASVKQTLAYLADSEGFEVLEVKPDADGKYNAADFVNAADDNTCMITMMMVNNETGHVLPVKEVFAAVKRRFPHIITHCDAVQAYMKYPVKVKVLNADFLSVSGHKIHAPKGVGALYAKKGVKLRTFIYGGKQESSRRGGTESVPLIAAFGAAAEEMQETIDSRFSYVKELNAALRQRLSAMENIKILSPKNGSPYILSIVIPKIRSEIMLHYLEQREVYVSSGSACSKGAGSGVPETFGASHEEADSVIRISLSHENNMEDIEALVEGIKAGREEIMHR